MAAGTRTSPTVEIPPWSAFDDPMAATLLSYRAAENFPLHLDEADSDELNSAGVLSRDACLSDEFHMYEFKVRRCARGRAHDWTQCLYAHPGEKARRRDPRRFRYSGESCAEFRKSNSCGKGDACEFAHGVFETWLHPSRYRTQPCKDGAGCRRRVCFFAHKPDELRVCSDADGSSRFQARKSPFGSPPTSILMPPLPSPSSTSPPVSPMSSTVRRLVQPSSVKELVASLRELQISNSFPLSWAGSPEVARAAPMFRSLPSTPTVGRSSRPWLDVWDSGTLLGEEEKMERVESGKDLRAKMFERLLKENVENSEQKKNDATVTTASQDVGWVSELAK